MARGRTHYPRTILYFVNGSIGDFLMVVNLLEEIHRQSPHDTLTILTPRNARVLKEILASYPYITLLEVNRRTIISVMRRFMFRRVVAITPPTPGTVPFSTKLAARLLAVRGVLIGFEDVSHINRYLYTRLIPYTASKLAIELLADLLPPLTLASTQIQPRLHVSDAPDVLARFNLFSKQYVVLHPRGSSSVRSMSSEEVVSIVRAIGVHTKGMKIILTGSAEDVLHFPQNLPPEVVVVAGHVSLHELATILAHSLLYIGVDTGITHLAGVLGVSSLVIAHNGTPHWLPYYNPRAVILYAIEGDSSGTYEGRAHLEALRGGRVHYLARLPHDVVLERLGRVLTESLRVC